MKRDLVMQFLRKFAGWLVGVLIATALLAGAGVLLAPAVADGPVVQPLQSKRILPALDAREGK